VLSVRISQKDLAIWFDVDPTHIQRLTHDGVLRLARTESGKEIKGRYDAGENVQAFVKHLRKLNRKDYSGEDEARRLRNIKLAADAKISQLKAKVASGELIDRKHAIFVMTQLLTSLKNHVLAVPDRVSRLVLGLTTLQQVREVLKRDHELVLQEAANFDMALLTRGGLQNGETNGKRDRDTQKKARRRRAK